MFWPPARLLVAQLGTLVNKLGLQWKKKRVQKAFDEMSKVTEESSGKMVVTFESFAIWWSRYQIIRRRDVGRRLNELFQAVDGQQKKILAKPEFVQLIRAANKDPAVHVVAMWPDSDSAEAESPRAAAAKPRESSGTSPNQVHPQSTTYAVADIATALSDSNDEVDPDQAWEDCRKVPLSMDDPRALSAPAVSSAAGSSGQIRPGKNSLRKTVSTADQIMAERTLGVNFASFESYWKERMNMDDPDIPVLPEFMVLRIGDKVAAERALKNGGSTSDALTNGGSTSDAHVGATSAAADQSKSKSWMNLTDKLRALIHMKVRKRLIFCAILYV